MNASVALRASTEPAQVRCHTFDTMCIGSVEIDGLTVQSQDPALLDALGAAFILAATQLADAKAKAAKA